MIEISEKEFLTGKYDRLVKEELSKGNLIIFPSESSYGFAGNSLSQKVCDKIHSVKKEGDDKPIGVIIDETKKIKDLVQLNGEKILLEHKFSHPVTVLLRTMKKVPCTSNDFIGARIPLNKTALKLCSLASYPLTAPSANLHGEPTIYDSKEIKQKFGKENFIFINGGELKVRAPSTYYHFENKTILRAGEISLEEIQKVLK